MSSLALNVLAACCEYVAKQDDLGANSKTVTWPRLTRADLNGSTPSKASRRDGLSCICVSAHVHSVLGDKFLTQPKHCMRVAFSISLYLHVLCECVGDQCTCKSLCSHNRVETKLSDFIKFTRNRHKKHSPTRKIMPTILHAS